MFEVHVIIISIIINVALFSLLLLNYFPKVKEYYRKRKKQAERRKVREIRKHVREYLNELKK